MDVAQLLIGALVSALLLYQGLVLRQFAKTVERLERVIETLADDVHSSKERIARLEATGQSYPLPPRA